MGARYSSEIPSPALTFLESYINYVTMVPILNLKDSFTRRDGITCVGPLRNLIDLFPYFRKY